MCGRLYILVSEYGVCIRDIFLPPLDSPRTERNPGVPVFSLNV